MIGWLQNRNIRVRLTLWYLGVLAVVLAAFDVAVYVAMSRSLENHLDESVEQRWESLALLVEMEDGVPVLPERLAVSADADSDDDDDEFDDDAPFARTWVSPGDPASGDARPLPDTSEIIARAFERGESRGTAGDGEDSFRVRAGRVDGGVLEVGESRDEMLETLASLRQTMFIATPIALLAASAGGLLLAQRALSPIDRVTRMAQQTTSENLGERLNLRLPNDEVGRLARTFDDMIDRLDASFRQQRQFTADASHELRTPLTALKGQVEVALSHERSSDDYRAVLTAVNVEVDRLIRLVGSLLTLARADAGQIPLRLEEVDLAELVESSVDQVRPFADERGVTLAFEGRPDGLTVSADEVLLLQLLMNLLDNAVRHTAQGGSVRVRWDLEGGTVSVAVSDTGIGIAAEHLPHIFERFYRVDTARSRGDGGTGLGLAISEWIARAHNGSLSVESRPGAGSTFTLRIPASRS